MAAPSIFSRAKTLIAGFLLAILITTAGPAMAETPQIDWKTLPEYMAMDRDAQRQLIWDTRRAVMRKLAETDFDRAECVAELFDFDKEEGKKQFYDTKGYLAYSHKRGSSDTANGMVIRWIEKKLCKPTAD